VNCETNQTSLQTAHITYMLQYNHHYNINSAGFKSRLKTFPTIHNYGHLQLVLNQE